jgi:hypothetical protein
MGITNRVCGENEKMDGKVTQADVSIHTHTHTAKEVICWFAIRGIEGRISH